MQNEIKSKQLQVKECLQITKLADKTTNQAINSANKETKILTIKINKSATRKDK